MEYGCILGNETVVFIKAGLGGNYLGDENKYLSIARMLNRCFGCTVISVSNPNNKYFDAMADRTILDGVVRAYGLEEPEFYFFGNSNGCNKGLALAATGVYFRRMILVNMPLTINFHKTKSLLSQIPDTDVIAVYGEKDISSPFAVFLERKHARTQIVKIPNADHTFTGKTEEFISLAEMLIRREW